jgi:5-methylcytosine-specific restriction endonuclease McrA
MRVETNCVECGAVMSLRPYYYFKKGIRRCSQACATLRKKRQVLTPEWREKIGAAQRGRPGTIPSPETRAKLRTAKEGYSPWRGRTPEQIATTKAKIGAASTGRPGKKGATSHFWRGGASTANHIIRQSAPYRRWRNAVLRRDRRTCLFCGVRDVPLNVDHIQPFAFYPDLRFELDNGRTLCVPCHKTTDTYMNPHWKPSEQEA